MKNKEYKNKNTAHSLALETEEEQRSQREPPLDGENYILSHTG